MFSAFQTFGRLGAGGLPFSERALWPLGASSPGLWIDGPSYPAACWQDSAGTTALSTVGTVLDSSNPVGLVLDRKGGLQLGAELVTNGDFSGGSTGWIVGTGWSISGGGASNSGSVGNLTWGTASVVGKTYVVELDVISVSNWVLCSLGGGGNVPFYTTGHKKFYVVSAFASGFQASTQSAGHTCTIDNISVREIPGLHLSQSTSAARPVASARVNLLTSTEDLTNTSAWPRSGGVATPNASTVTFGATGDYIYQTATGVTANMPTASSLLLSGSGTITINVFDAGGAAETQLTLTGTPTWYTLTQTASGSAVNLSIQIIKKAGDTATSVTFGGIQMNLGSVPLPYQRVGAASDYDTTGFPLYTKFDGTDDELATATFPAGTLTSSMDCLIAVRRDSADRAIVGLYTARGGGNWFGLVLAGDGNVCFGAVGSPTVFVDGAQLPGGTTVSRDTLHTALTVGAWHIMEFRGMDMSAWTATLAGNYGSGYQLNGALGAIQFFASGQDANRDKARARMAAYFGVTLP